MTVYTDSLLNGWQNWGWATLNYSNTSPIHSGSYSISVTIPDAYEGIQIWHPDMSSTPYANLSFWLNGGATGGQQLQIYGLADTTNGPNSQQSTCPLDPPPVNSWMQYTVPLSALGVANEGNFTGFVIQDSAGVAEPVFYLDDIQLNSATPAAVTHLTVNANLPIRTTDARWFGLNTPMWDSLLDTSQTMTLLTNMGAQALRFPGGSDSDDYHWLYNRQDLNTWSWSTTLGNFIHVVTNLNAQTMITLNYGTGYSNEAAAWVAYANASTTNTLALGRDTKGFNWLTVGEWASLRAAAPLGTDDGKNFLRINRTTGLGFKYWEIGNEVYGSWETDSNSVPHDPYIYATRAQGYISLMKAVDPTIKVGVVVTPGEDSFANYTTHAATNSRTGEIHYGWTPVLLATLKSLGITPDFLIHHRYPQNPGDENDAGLLENSSGWASDAADLRRQITDYMGSSGTNIELVCTENNSVSSDPGKQSTSLVNGLFKADSLGQLMQTEFNGLFWWALRNGPLTNGVNNSSSLYGWRSYGDYGVVSGFTDLYPSYYISELMQDFVGAGDTVITASSDYSLLSTYAVRRLDGRVTVLAINKDPANTVNGQVLLTGYSPAAGGTVYSYGMAQDNAAKIGAGNSNVVQTTFSGAGTNFSYSFPPYSATVLMLSPTAAKLTSPSTLAQNQFIFQLQGQPGVPYVVQNSTNLIRWTSITTNTLASSPMAVTNSLTPLQPTQFWRVIWQP